MSLRKRNPNIKSVDLGNSKKYFDLINASEYFRKIMKDYTIKRNRNITYSDINSLLRDYRNEKLLALPESDILKDDVGEEMRKLKDFQNNFQRQSITKTDENKRKKNIKKRENRMSFLISLEKFEKQGRMILPFHKSQPKVTFHVETELNPNKILYHKRSVLDKYRKNFKGQRKRTIDSYSTKTISDFESILNTHTDLRTTIHLMHNHIENLTSDLENDSKHLINTYSNHIRNFTYNYDEWKKAQEFKLPEIRKGLKKYDDGIK